MVDPVGGGSVINGAYRHNCMAAADSAAVLLELNAQWDLARTH